MVVKVTAAITFTLDPVKVEKMTDKASSEFMKALIDSLDLDALGITGYTLHDSAYVRDE